MQISATNKNLTCLYCLLALCLAMLSPSLSAGDTYYTDTDNEDNARSGSSDDDIGRILSDTSLNYPIEFNINLTGSLPSTSAQLLINAHDIDEELGQEVSISINGNDLGDLSGVADEDSTNIFNVPIGQIVSGNNIVEVTIANPWATRVNWGQLLIDEGDDDSSEFINISLSSIDIDSGTVTLNLDTEVLTTREGAYGLEVNLVDQNGTMHSQATEDFPGLVGQTQTRTNSVSYQLDEPSGNFLIEAHLFFQESGFDLQQDYASTTYSHIQDSGPDQLPANANFSLISANNASIVANGSATTTITLDGYDLSNRPTAVSGQTVLFFTTAGSISTSTDNGDGSYSATLTAPISIGTATISATLDGATVSDTAAVSLIADTPSIATSRINADTASLPASGLDTSVITVQLSDINNNDLARGGNSVDITADIGSVGPVTDLGNGSYTAVLTSSTTVGTATISASLEGSTIVDTTSVEFTPLPASMSDTLITATPNTLTADGSTTSTILLQAINVLGNGLNSGGSTVSFAASMGSIGDVTDLNDGFYSATYTSPTNTGVAIISATFDGEDVIDTEMINLQAGALLASSGVITSLDAAVIANGSNTTTITVQGSDVFGNSVEVGGATVTLNTNFGSLGAVSDMGDGRYNATLLAPATTGTAVITGTMNGQSLVDTATVQFVPGPASYLNSTLNSSSPVLTANGSDTATLTLQAIDLTGNYLTSGGDTVIINSTAGSHSSVNDLGDGTYQVIFTADETRGVAVITAELNGVQLSDTASISMIPGNADYSNSQVNSSLSQIVADGQTLSQITVEAIDEHGNALTNGGDIVTISSTLGSVGDVTDLGDGRYQASLQSDTTVGTATVSATINFSEIADVALVSFMSPPTIDDLASPSPLPTLTGTFPQMTGASFSVGVNHINYTLGDGNLSSDGSNWSITIPTGNELADGTYDVTAQITDIASQISSDTSISELLIDTVVPTISLNILRSADSSNILTFPVSGRCTETIDTITITVTDGRSNSVSESDMSCSPATSNEGSFSTEINLSSLQDGDITINASIADRAGNQATDQDSVSKTACAPDNTVEICDNDSDGISNGDEISLGLDPDYYDSDGDGISDLEELGADLSSPFDSDGDGILDALDTDSDNDGINDAGELGSDPNLPQDSDNDGTPDYRDRDSDNDHIPDYLEHKFVAEDFDNDSILNHLDLDSDGDGLPDAIENGVALHLDSDDDGIDNGFDVDLTGGEDLNLDGIDDAISLLDSDGDNSYNIFDLDSDNDGMNDELEAELTASLDSDGDGINDAYDVDSTGGIDTNLDGIDDIINPPDTDDDGFPDYIDLDSDNDGFTDVVESGGTDNSPIDGIHDTPDSQTSSPTDTDGDGLPNHLELESGDSTNDGNGPFDIDNLIVPILDADQDGQIDPMSDTDGDGILDSVDEDPTNFGSSIDIDGDSITNSDDLDDDNDGIPDIIEGDFTVDTDADGQPDKIDLDSDNDGLTDIRESNSGLIDLDSNGVIDTVVDANADGLDDAITSAFAVSDTDNDGVPDFQDLDSDNDEVTDLQEANLPGTDLSEIDSDNDGMVDLLSSSSGLSSHVFSTLIDSDEDGTENYRDRDSDNDGYPDGLENGDFDNNGIIDLAEDDDTGISTAKSGTGGTINPHLAWLLLLLPWLYKSYRAIQHKHAFWMAIVFLPLLMHVNDASADNNNQCAQELKFDDLSELLFQPCWYVSAGLGYSYLAPSGESNGWSSNDKSSIGFSFLAGRHLSEKWALELDYSFLGEAGLKNSNPTLNASLDAAIRYRAPSLMIAYRFLPQYKPFNAHFKLGGTWLNTEATDSRIGYEEESTVQVTWGIGAYYRFTDSPWFISFDYTNHAKDARFSGFHIGRYFGFKKHIPKVEKIVRTPFENLQLQLDSDQDGVIDKLDECPLSDRGVEVDKTGCCTEKAGCIRIQ